MTQWTTDELARIGNAEELEIASLRVDGTLRRPTIIWVVRVGDDLYVRSVHGRTSHWFRGVQVRYEGQVRAGGITKDVTFVEVDAYPDIHDQIDDAYHTKYRQYPQYVPPTLTPEARGATIQLVPRS